ncbi:MAG: hypothetical protein IJ303_02405, partial [Clostridia bacterium]|nr:hypothetical protein [Clostridia bacterium]
NFLCSIWEFYKSHDASDYDRSITNTKYDNYFWTKSDAAFQLVNGEIYYIDSQEGFIKTIDGIPVINIKAYWKAKSGGNWIGSFSRLYSEGTKLIYSLPSSIWYYDLTSGENEKIFTPANSFGTYFFIYGYKYLDGKLICELNDYPLFDKNTKKLYSVSGTVTLKDPFQITLGSDKAIVNTEVCIPISICGNPGISDIELAVYYNSQALTLVKCERSNAFPFDASTDTSTPGKITLYLNSDHDWWKNGTCIWLTFKINETASISDYNIIAEKTVLKNQSGKDLSAKLISGMATVLGIGDVSGDHRINTRDVVLVAQLVAEWENISLYSSAADCNGDGIINTRDIVLLAQYIAGWGVHLGK